MRYGLIVIINGGLLIVVINHQCHQSLVIERIEIEVQGFDLCRTLHDDFRVEFELVSLDPTRIHGQDVLPPGTVQQLDMALLREAERPEVLPIEPQSS